MATVLLSFFIFLAVVGMVALIAVIAWWQRVEPWYVDLWPKIIVAVARMASALGAVFAREPGIASTPAAAEWNHVCIAAFTSWAFWEIAQFVAAQRVVKTLKTAGELRKQVSLRTRLLTTLRRLVNGKRQRVEEILVSQNDAARPVLIARARDALSAASQIHQALQEMALLLSALHGEPESEEALHQGFRLGLYLAENGVMRPWDSFETKSQGRGPFVSYRTDEPRFRLDNDRDPAHVVRCVKERRLLIVSDCAEQDGKGGFCYFRPDQRNYLKSLLTYPILSFRGPDGNATEAALAIDTDVPGFFKEADREIIQFVMDEFAARLMLEACLLAL